MGVFSSFARGIYLDDNHIVADPSALKGKVDFVVSYAGWGQDRCESFTRNIQVAKDAGALSIMYYRNDPESYVNCTFNPDRWPDDEHDWQMQVVNRQLMSGTTMRYVHAIILDCTMTMGRDGKTGVTSNWMRGIGQWFADKLWKRYHLPVYVYLTPDSVAAYPNDQVLPVWMANMGEISTWKSAYLNNPTWQVVTDFDIWPVPDDLAKPDMMYAKKWDFWKYANTKFGVQGISTADGKTPAVPMWLYAGTRAKLFADNFVTDPLVPVTPPPPPADNGSDNPPDNGGDDPPDNGDDTRPDNVGDTPPTPPDPNDPLAEIKAILWASLAAGIDGFCHFWTQARQK